MATELRLRGGTTAQHSSFTGAQKEVTVDVDKNTIVVHDGSTEGGFPLAKDRDLQDLSDSLGDLAFEDNALGDLAFEDNALGVSYNNSTSGLSAANVQAAIDEIAYKHHVGEVFYLWDHLSGVDEPDNSGDATYIRLTANDSYNNGLLENESVSGSAPKVVATAQIATGPLQGQTVHLINTEQSFLRARGTSGALQFDQGNILARVQSRIHGSTGFQSEGISIPSDGSLSSWIMSDQGRDGAEGVNLRFQLSGDENHPKSVSATAYMRIA